MKKFKYKAKNSQGKTVVGIVEAADEKRAVTILRSRGLVAFSLSPVLPNLSFQVWGKVFQRITLSDLATFTRQLSTMVTTGLTLNEGLSILREQSPSALTEVIGDLLRNIEGGSSLAVAMSRHPAVFNRVYVALVAAGEAAGVLDEVLARLAENLEKQREFQAKVKGAMIYPAIIIMGMIGVSAIMMVFVIPKLLSMYQDFQAQLPLPTLILINLSNFMVSFWWLLLLLLGGAGWFLYLFRRTDFGRRKFDEFLLRLPIFGRLQKEVVLTEMTRTLGLLVGAGIPFIEALNITAQAAGNSLFEERLKEAARQVEKGFSLAAILAEAEEFPPIVPQMISVGEETGKMDEVLAKLSAYFEQEAEHLVRGLTTAIEPLIMVILGVGVAFLVISIILPIYNLTSQF